MEMTKEAKISDRLKELRENKGIKQTELAEIMNVSRVTIGAYEKGTAIPSTDALIKVAKMYNISMDWLCGLSSTSNGNKINNLADVVEMILSLLDIRCTSIHQMIVEEWYEYSEDDDGNPTRTYPEGQNCILFGHPGIWKILSECKKMYNLYNDNIIDGEVYNLWKEKIRLKYKDAPIDPKEYLMKTVMDIGRETLNTDAF